MEPCKIRSHRIVNDQIFSSHVSTTVGTVKFCLPEIDEPTGGVMRVW
jgi:hypothetical protein